MKGREKRSVLQWVAMLFEGGVRLMVGCFVLGIVFIVAVAWVGSWHYSPLRGHLPAKGPRVPIPVVPASIIENGEAVYRAEDCSSCHKLEGVGIKDDSEQSSNPKTYLVPDLTHEGQQNPSIDWQIENLEDHHRIYPNSIMPDYDDLPPNELRNLASFLASRK